METQRVEESTTDLSREVNKTYVISSRNAIQSSRRPTLQRRKTQDSSKMSTENTENQAGSQDKRLTLQRRTRTVDRSRVEKVAAGAPNPVNKILSEPNCRTPRSAAVLRSVSVRDMGFKSAAKDRLNPDKTPVKRSHVPSGVWQQAAVTPSTLDRKDATKSDKQGKGVLTPTGKTPFEKVSLKKDIFERLAGKPVSAPVAVKSASLERQRKPGLVMAGARCVAPNVNSSDINLVSEQHQARMVTTGLHLTLGKSSTNVGRPGQSKNVSSAGCVGAGEAQPAAESITQEPVLKQDSCDMENSAVTVAVRVRPFSGRETENAHQVIFVNNQETIVQHPDSKQSYSFTFDFAFCSIDSTKANFASQHTVYEKLARPLLERAFEGYNTCLFAYGQTGSGKSYTMMGFGEEAGVIPRFCEELFAKIARSENNKQKTCHLEMSYFEVYNEKIHDLLVVMDEQSQKKLPLRVREHPVFGPYIFHNCNFFFFFLNTGCFYQGWLELGNKQRATAATGMNDKSSRSHSVFTLIMTQTKTEFVEEEEHDHRTISRINLVDLAGSERCTSAQTSGDRLREGASINKSLLTLGKVISALSEQFQAKKRIFIPYRESVLTWLLKESLGGNSKTAMVATVSPAACNVEETLSTLRYAKQARMIINVPKVNEDNGAKLIRELKAEVEKLRAAQMSSQGIEPEKMRLFQQEIAALKMQLTQQQKEMAEAHRTWNEKLEQAEKRKREETKELQKAGITFKVDNRLPNLVNLNEDPQLSEMLLYMIKEGQTRVGKHKSASAHDIQLSGALIADEHCVISNVSGTVTITPIKDAKTFVNGNLISKSTVLHHGDRVILGGDHYFRFNHPVEVHSGKRVSCWSGAGDGQKDFEFAKNELLASQRAQLEAEIEAARLKAKEEMMQGIQVAKEMAQKELCDQKALYENKIKALEQELEEENQRKKCQELDNQRVVSQMEELQSAKMQLEQELHVNKKRLLLEAQATRQALTDHDIRHAKIIEALEAEKRKIAEDLERLQRKREQKENHPPKHSQPQWDAMKLSVMIEEANTISRKLKKRTVFSRHENSNKEAKDRGTEAQIQVQNTRLGISTFWSLEKFQNNLAVMRELDKGDCTTKDDDVFYDPNDEWEQDISAPLSASFSRRRSRSLLKSRRISGRLYEIRVHPIQSLHNCSQHAGMMSMNNPPSLQPSTPGSALPGICKELIGSAVAQLWDSHEVEESLADKLTSDLLLVHTAARSICGMYESLDDDSPENLFSCSTDAQSHLLKATSAMQRAVFGTTLWVSSINPSSITQTAEKLKVEVKKMGGYLQLLIQGSDSDIPTMVKEAQSKISQCLKAAVTLISHLSVITGTQLHAFEAGLTVSSVAASLYEGACDGVDTLLKEGIHEAQKIQREAQEVFPDTQVLQKVKKIMLALASSFQQYMSCSVMQKDSILDTGGPVDQSSLLSVKKKGLYLFRLNLAVKQLRTSIMQTLREKNGTIFTAERALVYSTSNSVEDAISGYQKEVEPADGYQMTSVGELMANRDGVHTALQSLIAVFDHLCAEGRLLSVTESGSLKADEGNQGHIGGSRQQRARSSEPEMLGCHAGRGRFAASISQLHRSPCALHEVNFQSSLQDNARVRRPLKFYLCFLVSVLYC
ncbi:kinesin-like protein KIF14 isoform X2 [Arapaima gigas]